MHPGAADINQEFPTPAPAGLYMPLPGDGRPFIRCGCGFAAVSPSQMTNLDAYREHYCPVRPRPAFWTSLVSNLFSPWGLAVVSVIFMLGAPVLLSL